MKIVHWNFVNFHLLEKSIADKVKNSCGAVPKVNKFHKFNLGICCFFDGFANLRSANGVFENDDGVKLRLERIGRVDVIAAHFKNIVWKC